MMINVLPLMNDLFLGVIMPCPSLCKKSARFNRNFYLSIDLMRVIDRWISGSMVKLVVSIIAPVHASEIIFLVFILLTILEYGVRRGPRGKVTCNR